MKDTFPVCLRNYCSIILKNGAGHWCNDKVQQNSVAMTAQYSGARHLEVLFLCHVQSLFSKGRGELLSLTVSFVILLTYFLVCLR